MHSGFFRNSQRGIPERICYVYMVCDFLEHGSGPRSAVKISPGGAGVQNEEHAVFWVLGGEKPYKGSLVFPVTVMDISPVIGYLCRSCLS